MIQIELYKFFKENHIEWHYVNEDQDVIALIDYLLMQEFVQLVGVNFFSDNPTSGIAKENHLAIYLKIIFDYLEIDVIEFFKLVEREG